MKVSGIGVNTSADSYSFYNSSSRVNEAARLAKAQRAELNQPQKTEDAEKTSEIKSKAIYQREDYTGPNETLVSSDNSFQKQQLSGEEKKQTSSIEGTAADTSAKTMERLAGKLVDKLPRIFKDIMGLSADGSAGAEKTANDSRVIIAEEDDREYLEKQAENAQLQDISLAGITK